MDNTDKPTDQPSDYVVGKITQLLSNPDFINSTFAYSNPLPEIKDEEDEEEGELEYCNAYTNYNINPDDTEIRFKKTHPDAIMPKSNHDDDSGYDVYSVEDTIIPARGKKVVDVGLEFAHIPQGYWIRVESRSGLSFKHGITAFNGIIDCVPAGTKIETTNGPINVEDVFSNLENMREVISYNITKNETEVDYIEDMWIVKDSCLLEIELDDRCIKIPPTKKLYTKRGWVYAEDLTGDDEILCL